MARLHFSRNVIGFCRQRAADRFRARQAFHNTNSVINAAAAETSRTGMRTMSACKREALSRPLQPRVDRKSFCGSTGNKDCTRSFYEAADKSLRSRAAKMERMISEFFDGLNEISIG